MDHVDISASPDVQTTGPSTVLHVRIPFTATSGGGSGTSGLDSKQQQRNVSLYTQQSIAKPTLSRSVVLVPMDKWIPDTQVASCMAPDCQLQFNLFNRKHHCRACGKIFCANCSSHTLQDVNNKSSSTSSLPSSSSNTTNTGGGNGGSALRVCSECFYENQLVVVRRANDGGLRRRTRGELKMLQWPLIVNIMSYLPLSELLRASAVSSDFYFMSRDNQIWFVHNMNRWASEIAAERSMGGNHSGQTPQRKRIPNSKQSNNNSNTMHLPTAGNAPLSRITISHHAKYSFTQFLDFAKRLEGARCQGLSSFSAGAKQLLSAPIKICVVGPSAVGKTFLVKKFVGELSANEPATLAVQASMIHATCGFATYTKRVSIVGGLTTEAELSIIDVAGDRRYDQLRGLCAQGAHAIVVCYDAHSKMSLVHAANVVGNLESSLGPQPVIVCGLLADSQRKREVSSAGAEGISVRCRASIQTSYPEEVFETVVQTLLDRLVLGTTSVASPTAGSGSSGSREGARNLAQELLTMSSNPSVLDVLLDSKMN